MEETVETKDSSSVEVNYGVIKLQRSKPLPPLPPFKVEVFVVSIATRTCSSNSGTTLHGGGDGFIFPFEVGKMSGQGVSTNFVAKCSYANASNIN